MIKVAITKISSLQKNEIENKEEYEINKINNYNITPYIHSQIMFI